MRAIRHQFCLVWWFMFSLFQVLLAEKRAKAAAKSLVYSGAIARERLAADLRYSAYVYVHTHMYIHICMYIYVLVSIYT